MEKELPQQEIKAKKKTWCVNDLHGFLHDYSTKGEDISKGHKHLLPILAKKRDDRIKAANS